MGEANFISDDNEVLFKSLSHQQIAVQQGLEAQTLLMAFSSITKAINTGSSRYTDHKM
jgi:hypothetical protein